MAMNLFTLGSPKDYVEQHGMIDPLEHYLIQTAHYLSRLRDISYEEAYDVISSNIGDGKLIEFKKPELLHTLQETPGNKVVQQSTLWDYVMDVKERGFIVAPSLTSYFPPDISEVKTTPYINKLSSERNVLKKKKFEAQQEGNLFEVEQAESGQQEVKFQSNSQSGLMTVASTALYNPTGHSSLTSTCRAGVSYANANNERIITGLRHYWSPDIVIQALLSVIDHYDHAAYEQVIVKYKLVHPTTEDVMDVIAKSTRRHFRSTEGMKMIRDLVQTLSPTERAVFVYAGDMYHLEKYNPEFVKDFILSAISTPINDTLTKEQSMSIKKLVDPDIFTLAVYLSREFTAGKKLDKIIDDDAKIFSIICTRAVGIWNFLKDRQDLISAIFIMPVLHTSIYRFPTTSREAVPLSDTDSTVFTVQDWVLKYSEGVWFSKLAWDVGYFMTYFFCQPLDHITSIYNANLGVPEQYITNFKLKNEYYFPITGITGRAKHYYGYESAQEGNIFKDYKFFTKGVGLRGSNTARIVAEKFNQYVRNCMDNIIANQGLTLEQIFVPVLEMHNHILDDLMGGGSIYLRSLEVKEDEDYTLGDQDSNAKQRRMWNQVFAPIYGEAPEPPYSSVTMTVNLGSKSRFKEWTDSFADVDLADRMREFIERELQGKVSTFRLPEASCYANGIPKEVISVIDMRKVTCAILAPFYIVMESFGIFLIDRKLSKLIDETIAETSDFTYIDHDPIE